MGMICWSNCSGRRLGELVGAAGFEPTTTTPDIRVISQIALDPTSGVINLLFLLHIILLQKCC